MADVNTQKSAGDSESEVWNAIAAFEKILEVMPEDRSSLETLFHAYEHIGDRAQALSYLLRLSTVVLNESDVSTAPALIETLEKYGGASNERIAEQLGPLKEMLEQARSNADQSPEEEAPSAEPDISDAGGDLKPKPQIKFRVADELSFAWKLFEAGEMSQEDYASVAHDLAELSIDSHLSTVSVLHALEGRAFKGMERLMAYAAKESKTPVLSLRSFEPQPAAMECLPRDFVIRRGALVFDLLQDEALVVVMNPFDPSLREDIEQWVGRKCHYFMALPQEFDAAVALLPDH